MLRPILRNRNLSSADNISKSVGSSDGSRFSCNFRNKFSAFLILPFACRNQSNNDSFAHLQQYFHLYLQKLTWASFCSRCLTREACLATAASLIIFSLSSILGWFPQREVAAIVSERVPAINGLLGALVSEWIRVAALCRACSSWSCKKALLLSASTRASVTRGGKKSLPL